jgi:hypothetical protein
VEGSDDAVVDSTVSANEAIGLADELLRPRAEWEGSLSTTQLAAACAELDAKLGAMGDDLAVRKNALDDARRVLTERFINEGVDQVRVETSAGKKLVHLVGVYAPSVLAADRPKVLEWLKANAPDMVEEQYNATSFKAYMKHAEIDGDGVFPTALVDNGTIRIFRGQEVRFRSSR